MKKGFTLIEVLIAMMIVAIAFTAILKATENSLETTEHLQSRMVAHWVATEILTSAQTGALTLPANNRPLNGKTRMLGQIYDWLIQNKQTQNKNINILTVAISQQQQALYHLSGPLLNPDEERIA